MDGLGELFKQIQYTTTFTKLCALIVIVGGMVALAVIKQKTDLGKRASYVLIGFLGIIVVVIIAAFFHPDPPTDVSTITPKYTLSITLTDAKGNAYSADQADITAHNPFASKENSPGTNTWIFIFRADDLPDNRAVYLTAQTKDKIYYANLWDTLSEGAQQDKVMILHKDTLKTFSINLSDPAVHQAIANATGLSFDPASPANKITVSYESDAIAHNQDPNGEITYSFRQSSPTVVMNGSTYVLSACTIPASTPSHQRDNITRYAEQQATDLATKSIRNNPNDLAQWIKSTLK
jgi:hypothetical protein